VFAAMPVVLVASPQPLPGDDLRGTVLGRQGVDRYAARGFEEAWMMALAARPELVLVDRALPRAEELVQRLRADEQTRALSIAIVARGDFEPVEVDLIESGANAVLRLPVDEGWDRRLLKLMSVPVRRDARFPVHLRLSDPLRGRDDAVGLALNLSVHGMLVEAHAPLGLHDRLAFAFRLREDDQDKISGRGHVVRQAAAGRFGLEFEQLDYAGAARIQHFVATLPA
jgi:CheY-like chemotaxis protein